MDDVDDKGPCYEAPVTGDAERARRAARRLGVAVLDLWDGAAAMLAGRGWLCGPGKGPTVPSVPPTVGSTPSLTRDGDDSDDVDNGGPRYEAPVDGDAALVH